MIGFDRENSDTIGFVYSALSYNAISRNDVSEWAITVITKNEIDELPGYVIDLMDFGDDSPRMEKIIGFIPVWRRNENQLKALYGIVFKRGRVLGDIDISKEEAISFLEKHPEVEKRFRETFPFIDW